VCDNYILIINQILNKIIAAFQICTSSKKKFILKDVINTYISLLKLSMI